MLLSASYQLTDRNDQQPNITVHHLPEKSKGIQPEYFTGLPHIAG